MDRTMSTGLTNNWTRESEAIVLGPYTYLESHPGKDIRRLCVDAFNFWLRVPEKSLEIIVKAIAMLHTASLLVDDVEDSATLRRGFPVAHSLYGVAQTINSSNYVYFLALQELSKLNNPVVYTIYTDEMLNLHRGQGLDLYWRDALICPTEDDYIGMVENKTSGLFRLAVKLMQAESDCKTDFVPLANLIGILYQIRDDYLNLQSDQYSKNKGFCEDLTEGKFSFPIIHSISHDKSNQQILNILKQHSTDDTLKEYAVTYMRDVTKSFDYTTKAIAEYEGRIRTELKSLDVRPNPMIEQILKSLCSS
ncbi:isoprenoid synthase domain-containing protein [Lipomyces kononenkoae]|uniref:Isoprenoid synthase domain-containing protein n=1 Tax=Lipomyces kononenkoae TaxID=34357 RepID=A0ACC3TC15_LIPKO